MANVNEVKINKINPKRTSWLKIQIAKLHLPRLSHLLKKIIIFNLPEFTFYFFNSFSSFLRGSMYIIFSIGNQPGNRNDIIAHP